MEPIITASLLTWSVFRQYGQFHVRKWRYKYWLNSRDSMLNKEIQSLKSKLQALRESDNSQVKIVDTLNKLAFAYLRIDLELTRRYAEEAIVYSEQLDHPSGKSRSLTIIALTFWAKGDFGKALTVLKEALKLVVETDDMVAVARVYTSMGLIYSGWSDYNTALDYYLKALTLFEEFGDEKAKADINNNIGVVYKNRGDPDRALQHFNSALELYIVIDNKLGVAGIYHNIGGINEHLKKNTEALKYYQKSLLIREELGGDSALADSYNNMGNVHRNLSDFDSSLEYLEKSLKIKHRIGDKRGVSVTNISMGKTYLLLKGFDSAQDCFQNALQIAMEIGARGEEMLCYKGLYRMFEVLGDFEKALVYHVMYSDLEKVLFRTEKKEKEAEIYRLRNIELQAAYDKTDELLRNILPGEIVEELAVTSTPKPRIVDDVTVIFIDIVNFTLSTNRNEPEELLDELALHFDAYDEIVKGYGLEKLKTFGDGYMYAGGLFSESSQIEECANAALDILDFVSSREWEVRIGIHVGSCIAGLIKGWRMIYDVWGETVNMAARLEQNGEPGRVNVSQAVRDELHEAFVLKSRGDIEAHNLSPAPMYFIRRQ
jgi:class 3 adenylate cyclase/Tfp pilus assembly protein PilF